MAPPSLNALEREPLSAHSARTPSVEKPRSQKGVQEKAVNSTLELSALWDHQWVIPRTADTWLTVVTGFDTTLEACEWDWQALRL